jgi:NCS1 family nucleobase:cation symporter-1
LGILTPAFLEIGGNFNILGLSLPSMTTFLLFWSLNILIIYKGMDAVKVFENWAAPIVLLMAAFLLLWVTIKAGGLGPILSRPSEF